jgi:hypothetical protein
MLSTCATYLRIIKEIYKSNEHYFTLALQNHSFRIVKKESLSVLILRDSNCGLEVGDTSKSTRKNNGKTPNPICHL